MPRDARVRFRHLDAEVADAADEWKRTPNWEGYAHIYLDVASKEEVEERADELAKIGLEDDDLYIFRRR